MSRFIGLDVHTQSCTAVVLGPSGRKLCQRVLETDARVLMEFVRSLRRPRYLCMEEGTLSAWLYEMLEPATDGCRVVVPPKKRGDKSDGRDAGQLAEHIRVDSKDMVRVTKLIGLHTELREAWTAYRVLRKDLVRVKTRLHASARSRGLYKVASDLYDPLDRHEVLAELPTHMAKRAQMWGDQLDGLVDQYEASEQWLMDVARRTPIVKRIATAPGIGPKRAAGIVAIMVTPWRFRTKRQLWSYSGLGVVTRVSAEWVAIEHGWKRARKPQTRGLNTNRHPELKNIFKGAAEQAIRMKDHPLQQHFERLTTNGTKPNLAKLTIARKIAAAVLAMWKNKEDYDPDKSRS
ncbi:MAG: transposase [Polyangiaceae bacterium]